MTTSWKVACAFILFLIAGCKREQRVFDPGPAGATPANGTVLDDVSVGQKPKQGAPVGYQESAYTVAEGKRFYQAYNCVGCHAQGGGAIGPPLMDAEWIYGSSLEQIHSTIVQGRPNGMPSFAGKIPDYQVWEIASYVRSMSGQLPSDVAPSRSDHMQTAVPEASRKQEHPEQDNQQPVKRSAAVISLLSIATGFGGRQTPLDPAGPQALHIEHTLLLIFWITSVVTVIVLSVLAVLAIRQHTRGAIPPPVQIDPATERRARVIVGTAIGITAVLLFVMMTASFITSHRTAVLANSPALRINVYGHEWWWEVEYPNDEEPYRIVKTANEIHVPAGAIVNIHGTSRDVIHSFWAPNIDGKKDLVPGYWNDLTLQVDQPGTWRGQCAEFCGLQHAHMAFEIVAQSREDFDNWFNAQLKPANDAQTPQAIHGREVFMSHQCVLCHTVRGTVANSNVGPDLTHIASRSMIGAGTLVNNRGNLAGWIANAQSIKPGTRMPPNPMPASDLNDVVAYLETLQ